MRDLHISINALISWASSNEDYDKSLATRIRIALQRVESVLDPTQRHLDSLRAPYLGAVMKSLSISYSRATVNGYARLIERVMLDYEIK